MQIGQRVLKFSPNAPVGTVPDEAPGFDQKTTSSALPRALKMLSATWFYDVVCQICFLPKISLSKPHQLDVLALSHLVDHCHEQLVAVLIHFAREVIVQLTHQNVAEFHFLRPQFG